MKCVNLRVSAQQLRIVTEPVEPQAIEPLMDALAAHFESYPGMRAFVTRGSIITSNDAGTRSIDLDIAGPRLAAIYDVAAAAYDRAREIFDHPRIQAEPPTLSLSQPLIEVRADWRRAAELGMNVTDLGLAVAALTDGAYVDEYFLGDDKIDIFLYSEPGKAVSAETLEHLLVLRRQK